MKPARLIVQGPEGEPKTYVIEAPETLIGRNTTADVQILDRAISRDHSTITWEDDHYVVEDLQTTNGTRVNGKRIRSVTLEDGDQIQVGRSVLTFEFVS